jgi:imidazole glycerol-phosphate synthase subunit HisH
MPRVAIIDYGLCNLDSIRRAVEMCGGNPFVTDDADRLREANLLILPGVGAFGVAMENLKSHGMDQAIREQVASGIPMLGICLGMQLLASRSTEGGSHTGLDLIPGDVVLLNDRGGNDRVPHIGWNSVRSEQGDDPLLAGLAPETDFYFVHSYHVACKENGHAIASTPYCGGFTSVIRRDNVAGTQFHPEKSQRAGFHLLTNFLGQQT